MHDLHICNILISLSGKISLLEIFYLDMNNIFTICRIQANNSSGQQVRGTCRIFLAPTNDERGVPIPFTDHRKMFIELDRFIVTCKFTSTNKYFSLALTFEFLQWIQEGMKSFANQLNHL